MKTLKGEDAEIFADKVIEVVWNYYKQPNSSIDSKDRFKEVMECKRAYSHFMHKYTSLSKSRIAKKLRPEYNQASIWNHIKKSKNLLCVDKFFVNDIEQMNVQIYEHYLDIVSKVVVVTPTDTVLRYLDELQSYATVQDWNGKKVDREVEKILDRVYDIRNQLFNAEALAR